MDISREKFCMAVVSLREIFKLISGVEYLDADLGRSCWRSFYRLVSGISELVVDDSEYLEMYLDKGEVTVEVNGKRVKADTPERLYDLITGDYDAEVVLNG